MTKSVRISTLRILLLVCLLGAMLSVCAMGATVTHESAKKTAAKYLPGDAVCYQTETELGYYELKFVSENRQEKYEVQISKDTGKLFDFESKLLQSAGGSQATLSASAAEKKVTNEIENVSTVSAVLDRDDGLLEYDVSFTASGCYGTYTIHPSTGAVLERDITIGTLTPVSVPSGEITYEKAMQLAKKHLPGGVVTDLDMEWHGDALYYEIEMVKDGVEYDLLLNGRTGEVISMQKDGLSNYLGRYNNNTGNQGGYQGGNQGGSGDIGLDRAKSIAQAKAPGAMLMNCERDFDDGRLVYEGELRNGAWEYDFTIDAATGKMLEWSAEIDD